MTYGERTGRAAVFVGADGSVERLHRIPLMSGSFNEAWMQDLLEENPSILPTSETGSEFFPLVCIGREVPVGCDDTQGYIDNLYITPAGRIVIVETKLFRNQESRRTVVAQVIDYAKEIQQWDSEKLNEVATEYFYQKSGQAMTIMDAMTREGFLTYSDQAIFVDSVNRGLQDANFLILIVGDGIRTGVRQLAEFLDEHTSMAFRLSLVELEVYPHSGGVVVVPNLLSKTTVIKRTIFSLSKPVSDSEGDESKYVSKPILTISEFLKLFSDNGGFDRDQIEEFIGDISTVSGISLKISPTELAVQFSPVGNHPVSILIFGISGNHADIYIRPGRTREAMERYGCFPSEFDEFLDLYKDYLDLNRCKHKPYEFPAGFYYCDVNYLLQNSSAFISALERFVDSVTEREVI